MADQDRPLYAVLIDADNVPAKHAEAILKEITTFGEPALRRVYGDWSSPRLGPWKSVAQDQGLVQHQDTSNTKGKNASDIGLVIDAMDILHSGRFDGFVLVSSDSDFTALANRIREHGLTVIGVGEAKTPPSLRKVCNRFVLIENLENGDVGVETADVTTTKENPTNAIPMIRKAMEKIDPDGEWYTLGQLGQYIQRDNPDFDQRTYGKAKLSELIKVLKAFELKSIDGHLRVRRTN